MNRYSSKGILFVLIIAFILLILFVFIGILSNTHRVNKLYYEYIAVVKSVRIDHSAPIDCYCKEGERLYQLCYSPPFHPQLFGKRFNCSFISFLEETDLLRPKNVIDLSKDEFPYTPIVVAASEDHKNETKEMLYHIRQFWPKHRVIFYDIGLEAKSRNEFEMFCHVEVRTFPFEKFPAYVRNLKEYRWKPIMLAMAISELKAIWYMDSSIRWIKPELYKYYDMIKCKRLAFWKSKNCFKSELLLLSETIHGIYTSTHPDTYKFLPTDMERIKIPLEYQSGLLLITRTVDSLDSLKWWILCALEEGCMAPKNSKLDCVFENEKFLSDPVCHRFDQTALNIILANKFNFDTKFYTAEYTSPFEVRRWASEKIDPRILTNCDNE